MMTRPDDFVSYWDEVDRKLAAIPAAPELTRSTLRSNEHCDAWDLRITSSGPYRIFGYFSLPKGDGPFPALLLTPGYGSVKAVPDFNDRKRYATLQIIHRGQRLADKPWAAAYPGLLTERIDDPEEYIYRDIVADCLRGAEFLMSRPEIDPGRVAVMGDDLAILTAARRQGFSFVVAAGLMCHKTLEACQHTESYPLEEINEYLRANPGQQEAVARSLSYLDPVNHASSITGTTLLSAGTGALEAMQALIAAFGGKVEEYQLTGEGRTDQDNVDAWLAARMGVPAMSRFIREFA
jgi:cephalosporin-C deacetylase